MRKFCFALFSFLLLYGPSHGQETVSKITHSYFRSDPFNKEFSQFLNNLINDPALTEKSIKKRTDSTLFFLQGIYSSHSPFFFHTNRCKIILAERQEYKDSLSTRTYTYFIYQLIGYAAPGEEGQKDIKQEFEKLNRRFKKGLDETDQKELKRGYEQSGAIINYSFMKMPFYPLTIAWTTSADHQENIIAITVRFYMEDNEAYLYLPIPPDSP
jgi:hypothetical protein